MGSGNSTPVEKAESVETEAHQDLFEIRFDHLALGGTAVILLLFAVAVYWLCRQRRLARLHHRRPRHVTAAEQWFPMSPLFPTQMMPPPQWMPQMQQMLPHVMAPYPLMAPPPRMVGVDTWLPDTGRASYDSSRFTEIPAAPSRPARPAVQTPTRPPPPTSRGLPSPRQDAQADDTVV